MWDAQAAALSSRFRVLRYDTRGHGASAVPDGDYRIEQLADDAIALADALGIATFAFCGLSLGGMVGQRLGAYAADRLTALVLANTSPRADAREHRGAAAARAPARDVRHLRYRDGTVLRAARARRERAGGGAVTAHAACHRPARLRRPAAPRFATWIRRRRLPPSGCRRSSSAATSTCRCRGKGTATCWPEGSRTPASSTCRRRTCRISNGRSRSPAAVLDFLEPRAVASLESGQRTRRAVLGDAHVDRAFALTDEFTRDFQELLTRYAWGDVWSRPGLDRRTRRFLVLAMTASLGRWEEFKLHVRTGLDHEVEAVRFEGGAAAGGHLCRRAGGEHGISSSPPRRCRRGATCWATTTRACGDQTRS